MSSGGGQQTSSTKVEYSPYEQAARDQIAFDANRIFQSSMTSNNGNYTGAKPVGPSLDTKNAWGYDKWAAQSAMQGAQGAQGANNELLQATDVTNNPALEGAMTAATRPLIDQFQNAGGPMSTIRNNSVATGGYGGSRQGIAEGLAMQGLQNKVGDIRQTMMSEAYGQGLDAQGQAVKNQAMVNMMMSQPGEILGRAGAQQEGYQQTQENYNAAARDYAKNYQWEPLQNFANIIYGGSNGTTSTTQSVPKTDHTGQIIGTVGTMAMMAAMMM